MVVCYNRQSTIELCFSRSGASVREVSPRACLSSNRAARAARNIIIRPQEKLLVCQHANIKLEGFSLGETPETLLLTADIKAVSKP